MRPYRISDIKGTVAILSRDGKCIMRNKSLLKKVPSHNLHNKLSDDDDDDDDLDFSLDLPQQSPRPVFPVERRPQRNRREPIRYGNLHSYTDGEVW